MEDKAKQLDKDFIALCKKYNMKRVLLVSEEDVPGKKAKNIDIGCYVKGGKGESAMTKRALKLLKQTGGIGNKTMKIATQRLEEISLQLEMEKSMAGVKKLMMDIYESGMSPKNKEKLKIIRDRKVTHHAKGEYEKAAKVREEEVEFIEKFGINKLANIE